MAKKVRIAAVADIHCNKSGHGLLQPLLAEAGEKADVLLIAGDLTDYGLPEEAHVLAKELASAKIPVVCVLGNHDHESGKAAEVKDILCEAGIAVLDGEVYEVHGIGIAGAKGFAGGFGQRALPFWGEAVCKAFVQEAVDEALKLETALARLGTSTRIALLHYSPIQATVEGEPAEIFAFLGSSRLEEPLSRYPVAAVFHGHAHAGAGEGATAAGIPVYNVSQAILKKQGLQIRVVEVPVGSAERAPRHAA